MKIYRILVLEHPRAPIDVEALPTQAWTSDFSDMDVSGLIVPDVVDGTDVVLVCEVDESDVDWTRTETIRKEIPWEMEVALRPGAVLKDLRLFLYDNRFGLREELTDHPSLTRHTPPKP